MHFFLKMFLKFVVSGKMGVGKSALINGLSGKTVAKESQSPLAVTTKITGYKLTTKVTDEFINNGVEVIIFDSPGLGDPVNDEEANLSEISKHCRDADLLIYCLDMRLRMTSADTTGMKELTQRVGPDVWKNAMFVLTFANEAVPSSTEPHRWLKQLTFSRFESSERKEKFQLLLTEWEKAIPECFRKVLKLPEELASAICIVPAGYHKFSPPDGTDWISDFWLTALSKIKNYKKVNKVQHAHVEINLSIISKSLQVVAGLQVKTTKK